MASPMATTVSQQIGSHRYSLEELLGLGKDLPAMSLVIRKLRNHPDLGGIVRASDRHLYNKSERLADVTNRRNNTRLSKQRQGGSSSVESEMNQAVNARRDSSIMEWQLRQRDSSDRSSQPHSAPTGIAAQQAENFQRFYRAVVSPTHVRVTAGGRIVPNTRATAPPEWNGEKLIFEPRQTLPEIDLNTSQQISWPQIAQTITPAQLAPTPRLLSTNNSAQENISSMATIPGRRNGDAKGSTESDPKSEGRVTKDVLTVDALLEPEPIKISPPSQFDHSKPFIYNGQLLYPINPGPQLPLHVMPVPYGMLSNPNFPIQQPAAFSPLVPFPVGQIPGSRRHVTAIQNSLLAAPDVLRPLINTQQLPPYEPFTSLPLLSEITKQHLHGYRSQLKNIDNQLLNNKHQIDESYMSQQRSQLMSIIHGMESTLESQLIHERNMSASVLYNASGSFVNGHQSVLSAYGRVGRSSGAEALGQGDVPMFAKPPSVPVQISAATEVKHQKNKGEDNNADDPASKSKAAEASLSAELAPKSDTLTKSRLTAAAAKARPFQPRSHTMVTANQCSHHPPTSKPEPAPPAAHGLLDTRFMPDQPLDWGIYPSSAGATNGTAHGSLSRGHTMTEGPSRPQIQAAWQRPQTFHGLPTALNYLNSGATSESIPYLIGTLPHGLSVNQATPNDLLYKRELSLDEVRARELYWGNAPRSAYHGLPKFDGKDFYPPSPTKEPARQNLLLSEGSLKASNNSSPYLYFENLFTESPKIWKNASPVRVRPSLHNITADSSHNLENGVARHKLQAHGLIEYNENAAPEHSIDKHAGNIEFDPRTPTRAATNASESPNQDFSLLFPTSEEAGYKSPSPLHFGTSNGPVTPQHVAELGDKNGADDDDFQSVDSWAAPPVSSGHGSVSEDVTDENGVASEVPSSDSSTIDIILTPEVKNTPSTNGESSDGVDRGPASSVDQKSLLLQNLLRKTSVAASKDLIAAAGPALSGMISPTIAQGYLPAYRGSAAASLISGSFDQRINSTVGTASLAVANFLPENCRLHNDDRLRGSTKTSAGLLNAEEYIRSLASRTVLDKPNDNQKISDARWNTDTKAMGPVMGSDW
ncbi:hypothetical protein B0O99DRAFT_589482 [Bisporella sp. PMI_857]|nr:hypothetical protein B0O99DRAFT_589482 [Bisporella sp. PMI_857]